MPSICFIKTHSHNVSWTPLILAPIPCAFETASSLDSTTIVSAAKESLAIKEVAAFIFIIFFINKKENFINGKGRETEGREGLQTKTFPLGNPSYTRT